MPERCLAISFLTAFVLSPSIALAQLEAVGGQKLDVQLRLANDKAAFKGNENISIQFVMTNTSQSTVRVLAWRTPFFGVTDNIFDVVAARTGPAAAGGRSRVSYIGPIVKRGPPTAEDFIVLAPGESKTETVNLTEYYGIYQASDYTVAYQPSILGNVPLIGSSTGQAPGSPAPAEPLRKIAVEQSLPITFSLTEGRQPTPKAAAPALAPGTSGPLFDSCNSSQQLQLKTSLPAAAELAREAANSLKETPIEKRQTSERYKTWFGAQTEARYSTVQTHMEKVQEGLAAKQVELACQGTRCSSSTFAYVFPTQPYKIYVCEAFWRAAETGTDSRSGTLVHEMSHFDITAGTDDVVYGQAGAKALALSNPDFAITNADSHEYFSENTPDLPM